MNPPRRRRANPPDERCRCAECDAMAEGINLDPEACMQAVADDAFAVGWSVSAVLGDAIAPPWAYTIGLWLSHQGPELTMFGLPVEHMTIILNSIGERIANGAVIEAGDELDGICPCPLAIREIRASSPGTRAGSRCCGCPVRITRRACGPESTSCADPVTRQALSRENKLPLDCVAS